MSQCVFDTTASKCLCAAQWDVFTFWIHCLVGPYDPHSKPNPRRDVE